MGKLNSVFYWLLFFKNDNLKYTAAPQIRSFNFFSLFYILLSLFKLSCTKKYHVYNQYRISYTLSFCYVIHYIVSEVCIGRRFFKVCFPTNYIAVTNESLIPYNLMKGAPETQSIWYCNTECHPKPNQKILNTTQF